MRRPRELKRQQLAVRAPAPLLYEVVSSAGKTLESRDGEKTVEFEAEAAGKKIRTVELVVLDPPVVRYHWLEGPLPFVEEEIEVVPRGNNSELRYRGRYATGRGLIKCAVGVFWVKRVFDKGVAEHLEQAKTIAEKRASRSKIHPPQARSPNR